MFVPVPTPEIEFDMFQFPGGEWHIKLSDRIEYHKITKVIMTHRIITMDDLMQVAIAKDALERQGIREFHLVMPYIPYARQDRCNVYTEAFTLKVFTGFLNSLRFNHVRVLDPHSDVAPALIHNCSVSTNEQYVQYALEDIGIGVNLVVPDGGARKKAQKLHKKTGFHGLIQCDKERNSQTGHLSGFRVYFENLHKEPCMIVDDICDGGGTFIGLAEELKAHNAGDLYLFVTHGLFSKGFNDLKKYFKHVFCTNSFRSLTNDDFITQYPIML
jgi:ribose-phosphate pyrophosphokinase